VTLSSFALELDSVGDEAWRDLHHFGGFGTRHEGITQICIFHFVLIASCWVSSRHVLKAMSDHSYGVGAETQKAGQHRSGGGNSGGNAETAKIKIIAAQGFHGLVW